MDGPGGKPRSRSLRRNRPATFPGGVPSSRARPRRRTIMPANHVACPHCRAVLKAAAPLALGQNVRCVRCGTPFTAGGAARSGVPVASPFNPPPGNAAARALALAPSPGGLLLLLAGGAALGVFCFPGGGGA